MRSSQRRCGSGPGLRGQDLLHRLVNAITVGHERLAQRLLANETDDRGGDVLVGELAMGDAQRLPLSSQPASASLTLDLAQIGAGEVTRALGDDDQGRDLVLDARPGSD